MDPVAFYSEIDKAIATNINEAEVQEHVKNITDESNNLKNNVNLLIKAIEFLDLTSLKGGETSLEIEDLCKKAANPIDTESDKRIHTAAVCVFPANAKDAIQALKNLNLQKKINVASVAADFPNGALPLQTRLEEISQVVNYGVDEVDIVIDRRLALSGEWIQLYKELKLMREACGDKKMKTILVTGVLPSLKDVYIASMVAMLAGSDFIKTSTGKEVVNATLPVGIVMSKAIKDYYKFSQRKVGFKPAGGIKTSDDVIYWMTLMKEELGDDWLNKDLFRIGASSVLDNIVNTIKNLNMK